MSKPSPDWDLVTFKWAATKIDGTPETGAIEVKYNGGVMMDDDLTVGGTPLLIFPTAMTFPLATTKLTIEGSLRDVGYVEFQVPATNDPDISGGGGTYTVTEILSGGRRRTYDVVADIDAPGRTVWLSKIAPADPVTGTPLPVVYYADFNSLVQRVDAIEAGGGGAGGEGGGVTSYNQLTDKPFIPTAPGDIGAQPAGSYVTSADSRLTDARTPLAHSQAMSTIAGLDAALAGKQASGSYATATALTDGLATKAATSHTHAIAQVDGLQDALNAASGGGGAADWDLIANRPTTFAPTIGATSTTAVAGDDARLTNARTPTTHAHAVADVTGLQAALDGKQASGSYATTTALTSGLAGKSDTTHVHAISGTTGLQAALDAKQATGDYATNTALAAKANSSDMTTALAGKASTTHSHAIADTTGLQAALNAKANATDVSAKVVVILDGTPATGYPVGTVIIRPEA